MNKVENASIKYQIDLEKYKNGQANEIIKLFDQSNKEIAKYIEQTTEVSTKKRYGEIKVKLNSVSEKLKKNVGKNIDVDGLIDYELKKQKHLLGLSENYVKRVKGKININYIYPTLEQVKTAALFKPATEGFTYDSYLNGIQAGLFNTWDAAVRTGYLTGMNTTDIVNTVMGGLTPATRLRNPGLINSLRNSVYANTRTLLQSFADETARRVYEQNEQYFGDGVSDYKYEYLATLDNRTCLVCGNCDGKLYKSLKDAPPIPQHRGCRCFIIPYFNIEGDTRASKDGVVSDRVTFEDWLKQQDNSTKKDVLGETRYKLFNQGVSIKQFVDDGKVISLDKMFEDVSSYDKYVNSGFFQKVFGISEYKDVSKRISEIGITEDMTFEQKQKQISKWIRENGNKDSCEYMVITDKDNNVLHINKGKEGIVGYSKSKHEREVFRNAEDGSLISYHNHNDNSAPSKEDLSSLINIKEYSHGYAVCQDGTMYYLKNNTMTNDDYVLFEKRYDEEFVKGTNVLKEIEKLGTPKIMIKSLSKVLSEEIINILMEEFDFTFTIE